MGWAAEPNGLVSGTLLPMMALHQSVTLHWKEDEEVEAHSLRYTATLSDMPGVMWPELPTDLGPASVRGRGEVYSRLLLPFNRPLVQRIEDWRQGRSVAVRIEIRGGRYLPAHQEANGPGGAPEGHSARTGTVAADSGHRER